MTGRFEAEILHEIATASEGDWIATTDLTGHRYAAMIAPIVANLAGESTPPGALFKLGPVAIQKDPDLILYDRELGPLLDRHCRCDHGEIGLSDQQPSVESAWCEALASRQEMNWLAVTHGSGPIRSLYNRSELMHGRKVGIEITTFRRAYEANTVVLAGIH